MKAWAFGALVAVLLAFGAAWKAQDWRYEGKLVTQTGLHRSHLNKISSAVAAQVQAEQAQALCA